MNNKLNIAIISKYLPSGSKMGPGYQVHYMANEFVKRGHTVTIFSQYRKPEDAIYKVIVMPLKGAFKTFKFMWQVARQDYSEFDVIHAHTGDALLFMSKNKPPHIRTFHGSSLAEAMHAKKPKEVIRKLLLSVSEYISCIIADKLVAVSENTKKFIPFIKDVIYNGVDVSMFKPGRQKSLNPSILFVGTLDWRKRGKMLVDIFKNDIKPKIPTAELWLVTNDKINENGVKCFGRIRTEELVQLYQKAWVFCLPSTYEGFGIPYIEAMACGTPVVASANLGAKEVLGNGKYGVISADSDLANSLIKLLMDEETRSASRDRGAERAKEFTFDIICKKYEELYANLIRCNKKCYEKK
jgi:glycosyltransferase involved in cell wall biosynthesis